MEKPTEQLTQITEQVVSRLLHLTQDLEWTPDWRTHGRTRPIFLQSSEFPADNFVVSEKTWSSKQHDDEEWQENHWLYVNESRVVNDDGKVGLRTSFAIDATTGELFVKQSGEVLDEVADIYGSDPIDRYINIPDALSSIGADKWTTAEQWQYLAGLAELAARP